MSKLLRSFVKEVWCDFYCAAFETKVQSLQNASCDDGLIAGQQKVALKPNLFELDLVNVMAKCSQQIRTSHPVN
jgi:hypothetical protein